MEHKVCEPDTKVVVSLICGDEWKALRVESKTGSKKKFAKGMNRFLYLGKGMDNDMVTTN